MSPRFPCVTPVIESFSIDFLRVIIIYWAEPYLESCQTSTMELSWENNQSLYNMLTISAKSSTADVRPDSEFPPVGVVNLG